MIILGIDPGLATTGYGVINAEGSRYKLLDYGVISTAAHTPLETRLKDLYETLLKLIDHYRPDTASVEELFFSTNVKTAMKVSHARGCILLALAQRQIPSFHYTPLQLKSCICGYGQADKKQIQYMVKQLLNLPKVPRPVDAADALALAICHSHHYRLQSTV